MIHKGSYEQQEPEHLRFPINSPFDDLGWAEINKTTAFSEVVFSSNRSGSFHLYKYPYPESSKKHLGNLNLPYEGTIEQGRSFAYPVLPKTPTSFLPGLLSPPFIEPVEPKVANELGENRLKKNALLPKRLSTPNRHPHPKNQSISGRASTSLVTVRPSIKEYSINHLFNSEKINDTSNSVIHQIQKDIASKLVKRIVILSGADYSLDFNFLIGVNDIANKRANEIKSVLLSTSGLPIDFVLGSRFVLFPIPDSNKVVKTQSRVLVYF